MSNILITGITGFIGKVLLNVLKQDMSIHKIDGIDNLSNSQYNPNDPLFDDKRIYIQICSVEDFIPVNQYDEIYHLASPVGPVGVLKYAGKLGQMIVNDTLKIANLAFLMNAKFIDISTSEVYGKDPNGIPQKEEIEKNVPSKITARLEYGVSKLLCEIILINQLKTKPLKFNIIRPYNIVSFGQQAAAGFVLPRFIEQAINNEPITVYQPGTQRRTFTDVRDFVNALILVMKYGKNGQIYNVGNPINLHSIMYLAEKIVEYTKSKSKISIVDPKDLHGQYFEEAWEKIPDISLIQKDTNWLSKYTLNDIIIEAVKGYGIEI